MGSIHKRFTWEENLLLLVDETMPSADKTHNIDHVQFVAERVRQIRTEPEFSADIDLDEEVLVAGAYLHDIGYHAIDKMTSVDSFEHIEEGVKKAKKLLEKIDYPAGKIDDVLYLIQNHDNAKWSIPNWNLPNRGPRLTQEEIKKWEETNDPGLRKALLILKEADSAEYTDIRGTQRTWDYGIAKDVPIKPNPAYTRALNEDRLSNLLIFPHLAWLNATTKKGKHIAAEGYLRAEQWVHEYCKSNNIEYKPDSNVEEIQWALKTIPNQVPEHLKASVI